MGAIGVHPAASRTGDQHVVTLTYVHDEVESAAATAEPGAVLRAKLTVAYAAQLELVGGMCHWAVYVALHLADAGARTKLVRECGPRVCICRLLPAPRRRTSAVTRDEICADAMGDAIQASAGSWSIICARMPCPPYPASGTAPVTESAWVLWM